MRTPTSSPSSHRPRPRSAPKDEFKDKVLDLRRVTRVTAGGKRFRFRATVIIGDERGKVGVGVSKGLDVAQTVEKARAAAKRHLIVVPLRGRTIPHEAEAKFSAAHVRIRPAKLGHGLIAGGAVRTVLGLAGIRDITAKCLGRTPNKLTNALATIEALKKLKQSVHSTSPSAMRSGPNGSGQAKGEVQGVKQ